VRHTVDRVEETKEADSADGSTEGLSECAHELKELLLFLLLFVIALKATLPLLECPVSYVSSVYGTDDKFNLLPGEMTHFLVSGLWRLVMAHIAGLFSLTESSPT
jgi:hypothetical protein